MNAVTIDADSWFRERSGPFQELRQTRQGRPSQPKYWLTDAVALPVWVGPLTGRIGELLALPRNWDSYGAEPIASNAITAFLDVLYNVLLPDTPAPSIVPSADGHLQAEWHTRGMDIEIEVIAPTHIRLAYRDGVTQPFQELELAADLTEMTRIIKAFTER